MPSPTRSPSIPIADAVASASKPDAQSSGSASQAAPGTSLGISTRRPRRVPSLGSQRSTSTGSNYDDWDDAFLKTPRDLTPLGSPLPRGDGVDEERNEDGEDTGGSHGIQSPAEEIKHDNGTNQNPVTINVKDETKHLTEAQILQIIQIIQQALPVANKNVTSQLDANGKASTRLDQPVHKIIHRFSEQQQKIIREGAKMMKLALTDVNPSHLRRTFCSGFLPRDDEPNRLFLSSLKVALKSGHFSAHGLDKIVKLPWGILSSRQRVDPRLPPKEVKHAVKVLWPLNIPLICEFVSRNKFAYLDVYLDAKVDVLSFIDAGFQDFTYLFSDVSRPDQTPSGDHPIPKTLGLTNPRAKRASCEPPSESKGLFRNLGRVWWFSLLLEGSILNFTTIAVICMAQLMNRRFIHRPGGFNMGNEIIELLVGYSGPWKDMTLRDTYLITGRAARPRFVFTFRYFFIPGKNPHEPMTANQKEPSVEGICLERESGVMPSLRGTKNSAKFQEGRCSIQTIARTGKCVRDQSRSTHPDDEFDQFPQFTSTILVDGFWIFKFNPTKTPIQVYGPSSGVAVFQYYIYTGIDYWRQRWSEVLDAMEECLNVDASDILNPVTRHGLMFDDSFKRSDVYFTALQLLRIFGRWIRNTGRDLKNIAHFHDHGAKWVGADHLKVLRDNWSAVIEHYDRDAEFLLHRIADKTAEVESLRDGLFNATALLEASRSTAMNRYVMVFTVVTIIFLPLGFVAAYFSMPLAQDPDPAVLSSKFTMAIIVGPLLTYFSAAALVIFVNHDGFSRTFSKDAPQKVFSFGKNAAVAAGKKLRGSEGPAKQDEVVITGANPEQDKTSSMRDHLGGILRGRRKRRAESQSGEKGVGIESEK